MGRLADLTSNKVLWKENWRTWLQNSRGARRERMRVERGYRRPESPILGRGTSTSHGCICPIYGDESKFIKRKRVRGEKNIATFQIELSFFSTSLTSDHAECQTCHSANDDGDICKLVVFRYSHYYHWQIRWCD